MIVVFSSMPFGNISTANPPKVGQNRDLFLVGGNSGNLMFHLAATTLSDEQHVFINSRFDKNMIRAITSKSKVLILPIANILSEEHPVNASLISCLKQVRCPIIVLGLGLQAAINKEIKDIKLGMAAINFLKIISEKSALVVTRGQSTLELCSKYVNTEKFLPLGCPSILLNHEKNLGEILSLKIKEILENIDNDEFLQPSVYTMGNIIKFHRRIKEDINNQINKDFEKFLLSNALLNKNWEIIFQQEPFMFNAYNKIINNEKIDSSIFKVFNFSQKLISEIDHNKNNIWQSRIKHHISAKEWIRSLKKNKIAFSSRIHGTIAPLMAGVPSICFFHDARTKELCETLKIPKLDIKLTKNIDEFNFKNIFKGALENFQPNLFDKHRISYSKTIYESLNKLNVKVSSSISNLCN